MPASLDNRTVFVTGASRGIGAALARRAGVLGARVGVGYRVGQVEATRVVRELADTGVEALAVGIDVQDPQSVDAAFEEIELAFGPIEALVNNAGVHRGGRVHRQPVEDFHTVLSTNLTGAFLCTRRAVPGMMAAAWGRIVNLSSVVGIKGYPGDAAYAASKAGLLGMTRALALELAPHGITVNAISPGFIETDLTRALSTTALGRINAAIPLARQGCPDEVADALSFLLTTEYATGSTLVLDGGWTVA